MAVPIISGRQKALLLLIRASKAGIEIQLGAAHGTPKFSGAFPHIAKLYHATLSKPQLVKALKSSLAFDFISFFCFSIYSFFANISVSSLGILLQK